MAYRQLYFRIHTRGYSFGWSSDVDKAAFKEESRHEDHPFILFCRFCKLLVRFEKKMQN